MVYIPTALRRRITAQAKHRCGYCRTPQPISGAQMHIEHLLPLSRGGTSDESNLWLACAWCNSYKGDQTHAPDPETGTYTPLFNPRMQDWREHFAWDENGIFIVGKTATGRATILALHLNNEFLTAARKFWLQAGWQPD